MNNDFNKEDLEYYLPPYFKGLSRKYIIDCIFNEDIQNNWKPTIGDIIVGSTGNIFVISGVQELVEDLGGSLYFFGGYLCNRDGGNVMNSTECYIMNKKGLKFNYIDTNVSKISDFRYVPYPHEINNTEQNKFTKEQMYTFAQVLMTNLLSKKGTSGYSEISGEDLYRIQKEINKFKLIII